MYSSNNCASLCSSGRSLNPDHLATLKEKLCPPDVPVATDACILTSNVDLFLAFFYRSLQIKVIWHPMDFAPSPVRSSLCQCHDICWHQPASLAKGHVFPIFIITTSLFNVYVCIFHHGLCPPTPGTKAETPAVSWVQAFHSFPITLHCWFSLQVVQMDWSRIRSLLFWLCPLTFEQFILIHVCQRDPMQRKGFSPTKVMKD